MRQKNIKYVSDALLKKRGVITDVEQIKINDTKNAYIEIGSGKGQFICSLAKDQPDNHFVAVEVNPNVCYRILEKKEAFNLDHLTIINGDANHLLSYVNQPMFDGIYLNFSDPWPKKKHHKRRLTSKHFLRLYIQVLKAGGFLQFRTDHLDFFVDSLEDLNLFFDTKKIEMNLDPSAYMTEYEEKKRPFGPIYQWIGVVKDDAQQNISSII